MIRQMTDSDLEAVNIMNNEDMGFPYPLEAARQQFNRIKKVPNYIILVYEDPKMGVIGYIHAQTFNLLYSKAMLNVLSLVVSSRAQKMGIGKKLMQALEDQARQQDYKAIRLNTNVKNTSAQGFYEALGYQTNMDQRRYFKDL